MNNAMFLSNPGTVIAIVLGVLVLLWAYSIYVSLIKKKNKAKEAFSSIDVQLKKRYDLIPNVLFIANKFMEHERGLLDDITRLRAQASKLPAELNNAEQTLNLDKEITTKMGQLMVNVENYPQLKSDQTMVTAMQTYNEVEEHISAARRFYNAAANELKNAVEIFPSSLIARMINVKAVDFFKAAEIERKPINAADFLK